MSKRGRRGSVALVQVVFSFALLVFLLTQLDIAQLQDVRRNLSLPFFGAAVALQLAGVLVSSLKWWLLLQALDQPLPYVWTVRVYLIGQFFNNFLPTTVGGDAMRVLMLRRRIGRISTALASVWVERLTGFVALTLIGWTGLGLAGESLSGAPELRWAVLLCLLAGTLAVAVALGAPLAARLLARLRLPNILNWRGRLQDLTAAISSYHGARGTLIAVMALAFAYQLSWVAVHAAASRALALHIPFQFMLLLVPLSDIVGLVPIFFNNLGAREGTFALLLAQIGVPAASAVALAFLIFLARLLVAALGGLLYLLDRLSGTRLELAAERYEASAGGAHIPE